LYAIHCALAGELMQRGAPPIPPFDCLDPRPAGSVRLAVPRSVRRRLGEFYTPEWLAELVLDRTGYRGRGTLLDPTCGEGVFLKCARRRGGAGQGYDVNPLAVMAARLDGLDVELRDALDAGGERFDFVAGNPPWINWRHLGSQYRRRIAPLSCEYGLFPHTGLAARLGGAMDDLSVLLTYVCADRLLAETGRLGFVLPQTLFQSAGGGRGFRRFELPEGRFLRVVSVDDLRDAQPFAGAATRTAVAVFEVSRTPMLYPVPYFRSGVECQAAPVSADPAAAWSIVPKGSAAFAALRGDSPYRARIGAHTGGAAGVFWVDVLECSADCAVIRNRGAAGRNPYPTVTAEVESALLHPLVRGRDVGRWRVQTRAHLLLPHHPSGKPIAEDEMAGRWPKTFAYFERFRARMLGRAHYLRHFAPARAPWWSMYNVGAYTFAPDRLVWREQSAEFQCAVIGPADPPWIADAKLILVACESAEAAHYLAAVLNSAPARAFIESYVVSTQISTHVLNNLRVARFDGSSPLHARLAELSRRCHAGRGTADCVSEIDRLAPELWCSQEGIPALQRHRT
jgi:hypothetical protein